MISCEMFNGNFECKTMTYCLILWASQGCRAHRRQAVELCKNEKGDRTASEKKREREKVRMDRRMCKWTGE